MIFKRIKTYMVYTKPKVWWLLVFTALGGALAAGGSKTPLNLLALSALTVALGCMGAEALANYMDRDIDALMERTKNRPLPRGEITPKKAIIFGLILIIGALITSYLANPLASILMGLGIFDYTLVYVRWLKRKSRWNILFGSFAGGAPTLIGYSIVANTLDLFAFLLALLVILWIPAHIWSLALRTKDDYIRAKVPMLPTLVGERTSTICIASASLLTALFSLLIIFVGNLGIIYLVLALILGSLLAFQSLRLLIKPQVSLYWKLFKFSSPYLALIYFALIMDKLFFTF
ncbi:MAG: heme o synthase [Nitrososphaerales archaeon]